MSEEHILDEATGRPLTNVPPDLTCDTVQSTVLQRFLHQ